MDITQKHNVASYGALKKLAAANAVTAGGSGDATQVTGITIDRMSAFQNGSMPGSAVFAVVGETTLASSQTLTIAYTIEHSSDNSTWSTYQSATAATVATATGDVNFEIAVDLNSAHRYVRLKYTPDLSASGTDTAALRAVGWFAGFDRYAQ